MMKYSERRAHKAAMKNTNWLALAEELCKDIRDFPLTDEDCNKLDYLRAEMIEAGLFVQKEGSWVLQGDYAFPSAVAGMYIFTGDRTLDPEQALKDQNGISLGERRRPN
jgi:hypothetical protein